MKILIGCEESQEVCKAFRALGHESYSCDILPCSGGHTEWHIQGDVFEAIESRKWDMIIAFPPCTYLSYAATKYWNQPGRAEKREAARDFFMAIINADCNMISVENPVGWMNTVYRKPDQIIHPWQYGHVARKRTCLWLKGLPKLVPTKIVDKPAPAWIEASGKRRYFTDAMTPSKDRAKLRSKTFPGIALAMAQQWGKL